MIANRFLPTDSVVRQLNQGLNVDHMKALFQQRLFASSELQIQHCAIDRIKYKPGKNCLVCYRLVIINRKTGLSVDRLLSARFYESGGSLRRFKKAKLNNQLFRQQATRSAELLIHLSELDCVIWVFPNDRKLKSLALLNNEQRLQKIIFPGLIEQHWGEQWKLMKLQSQRVHYLPEHTCCVRTQLILRHQQTGESKIQLLYGKTYYNNQGCEAYKVMRQLWTSDVRKLGLLAIPQPVTYAAEHKMLWQHSVPGQPVLEWLKSDPVFYSRFDEIAEQVVALHQSAIKVSKQITRTQLCQQLNTVVDLISLVMPDSHQSLESLVARLSNQQNCDTRRPEAILHGDLHLKNMLADEQQIYLIDLDDVHRGDPLQEIGSLIAAILCQSVNQVFSQTDALRMIQLFLYHYQGLVSWRINPDDLRWYVAVALVNERISRSISRLKEGRLQNIKRLLALATEIATSQEAPVWCDVNLSEQVMEFDRAVP